MSSFNQGVPGVPTLINSSAVLVTGNAASANALTVRQFGGGNVFSAQTSSGGSALFVGDGGLVGIGTADPKGPIHSYTMRLGYPDSSGSGTSNVVARIQSGSICLDFGSIGGTNPFWIQNHLNTAWNTTYPILLNPNGGYVGIGTTGPSYLLHVNSTSTSSSTVAAFLAPNMTTNADTYIAVGSSLSSWQNATLEFINYGSNTSNVARMSINGGSASMINLNSTGVGIGVTNPITALDVAGGTISGGAGNTTWRIQPQYVGSSPFPSQVRIANGWDPVAGTGQANYAGVGINLNSYQSGSQIEFYTSSTNNAVPTQRVVVTAAGNVGIGTASPGNALSVNGSLNAGAAYYTTATTTTKTGPYIVQSSGFDAVGTSHYIYYSSWAPNGGTGADNFGGVMIVIGKNLSSGGKAATLVLTLSKRAGAGTYSLTIQNNTVNLTTFSPSISGNDVVITSDSDMAVTWTFIAGA